MLEYYVASESLSISHIDHYYLFELNMDHGIDLVREELIDEKKELELDYNLIKKLESEIELLMMWKREGVKGVAYVKASGETETIYKICDPNRPSFDDFYLLTP